MGRRSGLTPRCAHTQRPPGDRFAVPVAVRTSCRAARTGREGLRGTRYSLRLRVHHTSGQYEEKQEAAMGRPQPPLSSACLRTGWHIECRCFRPPEEVPVMCNRLSRPSSDGTAGRERLESSPRGRSSVGRASASQAEGRGFEPHRPLRPRSWPPCGIAAARKSASVAVGRHFRATSAFLASRRARIDSSESRATCP